MQLNYHSRIKNHYDLTLTWQTEPDDVIKQHLEFRLHVAEMLTLKPRALNRIVETSKVIDISTLYETSSDRISAAEKN